MTRYRWQETEGLFHRLAPLGPAAREAKLAQINDAELVAEVEALLVAHDSDGLVDRIESRLVPGPLLAVAEVDLTGRLIRHYEVGAIVGRGGMGDVYRARDTRLAREVALKFLPMWLSRDPAAEERLLAEARALSALDHPNISTLLEVDRTSDGRLFLVTPFYEGETLQGRLSRRAFPPIEAADVALQVARGLAAAHERGVVHRDIKPANLLITPDGRVKILDFGIAKLSDAGLTGPGETPGTAHYMSPEQVAHEQVDARTDLWSLGVVLFEMLTGRRPVAAERSAAAEMLPRAKAGIPSDLAEVVGKLLQQSVNDRYPDAAAAAEDLASVLAGRKTARRRPRQVSATQRLVVGGVTSVVLFGALAVLAGARVVERFSRDQAPVRRIAVLPLANLSGDPQQAYFVAGMHDALITELSQVAALTVMSRQSVLRFTDSRQPMRDIASELGVDALVEGSVFRAGDSVRITVQLIRARPEAQLWAESYHGTIGNALGLQREAARAISKAVRAKVVPEVRTRLAVRREVDPRAQEAYLRGLYDIAQQHTQSTSLSHSERERLIRSAISHLEEAVRLEPEWPAAHARLAGAYHWLSSGSPVEIADDLNRRAMTSALHALELDEMEGAAHAALGLVRLHHELDWEGAEHHMRRAIALGADNHWAYALYLKAAGRLDEAIVEYHKAEERDPLSATVQIQRIAAYACADRHAEAIAQAEVFERRFGAQLGPAQTAGIRSLVGHEYSAMARHDQAIAALEHAVALSDSLPPHVASLAFVRGRAGQVDEARQLLAWLEERPGQWAAPQLYAVLGDTDRAVADLEQLLSWHPRRFSIRLRCLEVYRMLRDEPRVREMVRKIGYPS